MARRLGPIAKRKRRARQFTRCHSCGGSSWPRQWTQTPSRSRRFRSATVSGSSLPSS